jgi:membrane protein required for colicin V production
MTLFDYAVLIIIGLSVLLGVIRGLVREVLSLVAWVVAFVAAGLFGGWLADALPAEMGAAELRLLAGYAGVFLAVLVLMSIAAVVASRLVKAAGLGVEDRVLGVLFGAARGMLVVMVLVLLAGLTSLPRQTAWRGALFSASLEALAAQVKQWLPDYLSQRIRYD